MVKSLLSAGTSVSTQNLEGQTPLTYAARFGFGGACRLLLDAGADPNTSDSKFKRKPLHWAVKCSHKEVVKILLENGAHVSVNSQDEPDQNTPLHETVHNPDIDITKMLIEHGVGFRIRNRDSVDPLRLFIDLADRQAVNIFLAGQVDSLNHLEKPHSNSRRNWILRM